ncbi:MAG: prepilin peptidase, partial [Actinomycetota bacterium]|nr:prepilin peptidase [Actinomycetota bacterium]
MTALLVTGCGVLGLAIGSFLNVVVWRVPRGESVVRPPSACPGCGKPIRSRDNVPVLGWLVLRGRCRDCSMPISVRYPLVEAATALLFVAVALRFGADPVVPAFLYLAAVGLALALIDIDTHRLPNSLVLPSYPIAVVLLATGLLGPHGAGQWGRALLGGVALYSLYFALRFAYPAGMGFGDVKLAGVLGLYTGWVSWGAWGVGTFLGFLYGGLYGLVLIALGKAGRKTKVPYGPFLLAGAFTGVVVGQQL